MAHSDQSAQIQTLHSVPSHSQLVNYTQSLQHSRDVREAVKGKPQAVELKQATHLIRQGAEVVSIQRQRLQAKRRKGQNRPLLSFTLESGQNICSQQFVFVAIIYCTAT